MNSPKATFAAMVIGAVVLIGAISAVQTRMATLRTEHELIDTTVIENAPPTVAFVTVALGGFRGILADLLFLRCQYAKPLAPAATRAERPILDTCVNVTV